MGLTEKEVLEVIEQARRAGRTALSLRDCGLRSLPAEIGGLSNLTELDVSFNQLTSLPAEIGGLSGLTELVVYNNKLRSLPAEIGGLSNLTRLDVNRNRLTSLPAEIGGLSNLTRLVVYGNPLESPPLEVASQGVEAIRNYLREIETAEAEERLYEAKLLIVGRGKVGKTFLASRLVRDCVPEVAEGREGETTEGIEIEQWHVDVGGVGKVRVNFWDFGGQEIYHATHQFFLTKRSLYLFVWEAREDDDMTGFDYWLNAIGLLSDNSPVLVVMNKCDVRSKAIDEASIGKKFGNVVDFHKVSAIEGTGCDELRKQIVEEIGQLEHIGDRLPKVWKDVRKRLELLKGSYISYEQYKDICAEFGLDEERAGFLSRYYHDLGVFLHFEDNPVLRDYVFLEPEWATNAVYKVLAEKSVQEKYGRFSYEQLRGIWAGEYPEETYKALLELMKRFELCFELEGRDEYIVAELLAAERPEFAWDYEKNLRFEYRYDFMPAGIVTRFMSRNHDLHREMDYWRSGVVLTWEGSEALIVSDRLARRIRVWIRGEDPKGMLAIVRREIGHIHETLNEPAVEEMLRCVCDSCRKAKEPYFHSYKVLAGARRSGREMMMCTKSFADVEIKDLLGEYGLSEESIGYGTRLEYMRGKMDGLDEAERKKQMEDREKTPEKSSVDWKQLWLVGGFLVLAFVVVIGAITLASRYGGGFLRFMGAVVASFVVIAVLAVIGRFMGVFGETTVAAIIDKALEALRLGVSVKGGKKDSVDD